mgnify:CR=1 FL=1
MRATRRGVLLGGAVTVAAGGAAGLWAVDPVRRRFGGHPEWFVPDAREGAVRLESAVGVGTTVFVTWPKGDERDGEDG